VTGSPTGPVAFPGYDEALRYLWGLKRLGARPGPELTEQVLHALGDPHRRFRAIHVTGSKGKGSVSAMMASVLTAAGHRTGLYTSPHLTTYRERAQVDGTLATPAEVVEGLARVRAALKRLDRSGRLPREATFFEVTTAWAFDLFARRGVDVAVVEVGLGGRLDATNVLHAPVNVITSLELEHTEILGPTLTHIAREKAGILHRGAWAVTGVSHGEGFEELDRQAHKLGVPLWVLGREVRVDRRQVGPERQTLDVHSPEGEHPDLALPLLGTFQARNAALAVATLDLFRRVSGVAVPETAYRSGLASVRWPGRLQRLGMDPPFYLDATHTPESAQEVTLSLQELHPGSDPAASVVVFSCLADKRAGETLQALRPLAETALVFPLTSDRAAPLELLRREAIQRFPRVMALPSVSQALQWGHRLVGPGGLLLAAGGVYLAGAVLEEVEGSPHEGPDLADPARWVRTPAPPGRRKGGR
jgi:dihydrofolate synthase/folylpolyglutamate synthase